MPTSQARATTCRSTQSYWFVAVVLRTSPVFVTTSYVVRSIQQVLTVVVSVARSTVLSVLRQVRSNY